MLCHGTRTIRFKKGSATLNKHALTLTSSCIHKYLLINILTILTFFSLCFTMNVINKLMGRCSIRGHEQHVLTERPLSKAKAELMLYFLS